MILRWAPALLLLLACAPTLPQDGFQSSVIAQFDPTANPAVSPSPNDLVLAAGSGRVNPDPAATSSLAEQDYVLNYLSRLQGFPLNSVVAEHFSGALDPTSISAQSVRLLDTTASVASPLPLSAAVEYDEGAHSILLRAPAGGWERGHHYAVALVGGDAGLKGADGTRVVGSSIWGLLRLKEPLVACDPPPGSACHATTNIIPSQVYDPAGRLADQAATAARLEQMRLRSAPLLTFLEGVGVSRADVTLVWTFTIHDAGELTFDPLAGAYPFPSDAFRSGGHVALPTPANAPPAQVQRIAALNTLDGFATSQPLVQKKGTSAGLVVGGTLLLGSLVPPDGTPTDFGTVGLINVSQPDAGVMPLTACLGCSGTAIPAAELQLLPPYPLDERTTYGAYLTDAVTDTTGEKLTASPLFALARSAQTLLTADGHSSVSELTDAQAQQLEPFRVALQPALLALEARGLSRTTLVDAWSFTTQSTLTPLQALQQSTTSISPNPVYVFDATAQLAGQVPNGSSVAKIYEGALNIPDAQGGTLRTERVPFLLVVPSHAQPQPYPVALFRHDFSRASSDALLVAGNLAAGGFATLAIDSVWHGERSRCTGASAALPPLGSDDGACASPSQQRCDASSGRCVSNGTVASSPCTPSGTTPGDVACGMAGQGRCVANPSAPGGFACEGGTFALNADGVPVISGWNFVQPLNALLTRDALKQSVVDNVQLIAMLRATGAGSLAALLPGAPLDVTRISLVGQGLGGMEAALVTAVSPDVGRSVLNAVGADVLGHPQLATVDTALAAQGLLPGTAAYDVALNQLRWMLEPATPAIASAALLTTRLRNGGSSRAVLVQYISSDPVTENASTQLLIAEVNRKPPLACSSVELTPSLASVPDGQRHAFLTQSTSVTSQAQAQVVSFLQTGVSP